MPKWYVHINRGTIDHNRKYGTDDHPIAIKKGRWGKGVYCSEVELPTGSRIIYSPHDPILSCGARVVIECPTEPEIVS